MACCLAFFFRGALVGAFLPLGVFLALFGFHCVEQSRLCAFHEGFVRFVRAPLDAGVTEHLPEQFDDLGLLLGLILLRDFSQGLVAVTVVDIDQCVVGALRHDVVDQIQQAIG